MSHINKKSSTAWYKDMAERLRNVTYELRLEQVRSRNKLPLHWDLREVKGWILRARQTLKYKIADSLKQNPLTPKECFWEIDKSKYIAGCDPIEFERFSKSEPQIVIWNTQTNQRMSGDELRSTLKVGVDDLQAKEAHFFQQRLRDAIKNGPEEDGKFPIRTTNHLKMFFEKPKDDEWPEIEHKPDGGIFSQMNCATKENYDRNMKDVTKYFLEDGTETKDIREADYMETTTSMTPEQIIEKYPEKEDEVKQMLKDNFKKP